MTNIPFLSSNILSSPADGVFISQLSRYARACSYLKCFILRAMRLSNKLLGQGYVKEHLKLSLRKFFARCGDLIKQYEAPSPEYYMPFLRMTLYSYNLHWSNFFTLLLIVTLIPNLTFDVIVRCFHRTFATGAACQQRTLTPPNTWSCPTLGIACVLMLRWTCLVSGLMSFEHPSVLLFCSIACFLQDFYI